MTRVRFPAVSAGRLCLPGMRPPDLLSRAISRRTASRVRRVRRALTRGPLARRLPGAPRLFDGLLQGLGRLPPETRSRVLCGPDLRGFLGEAELWIEVWRLAAGGERPGAGPVARRPRTVSRLFDRIGRTEHLPALVPSGRVDRGFPHRAAHFAIRRLFAAMDDLAALSLGLRIAGPAGGRFATTLRCREEAEQGRPADRIDLGTMVAPSGAITVIAPAGRAVRARIEDSTLLLRAPGARPFLFPGAGSRLRSVDLPRVADRPPARPALARRERIPGSSILLGPQIVSRGDRLSVRREVPGLGARLARALRIVQIAWPEAHLEIRERTGMVVPVRERRLVSYSLASRPGISFINVRGKPLLVLADDLLHETAHHRLHAIEEIHRLLAPGPDTEEVQAFDSPWRGTLRPLHGLLHGGYTFLFRAELFRRVLRASRQHPRIMGPLLCPLDRAWVRRELQREVAMLQAAMKDLAGASAAGLLTGAGRDLLRAMRSWARRLGAGRETIPAG